MLKYGSGESTVGSRLESTLRVVRGFYFKYLLALALLYVRIYSMVLHPASWFSGTKITVKMLQAMSGLYVITC